MKPVLVYDGDCGFCRYWVARWRTYVGEAAEFVPYQGAASRFDFVPREAFAQAVHLIVSEDEVYRGAEAVFRVLSLVSGVGRLQRLYERSALFAKISEGCYAFVASNRKFFTFLTRIFFGLDYEPPEYGIGRWLFLRNLGLVFAVAFLSLLVQIKGLVGENGILPFQSLLDIAHSRLGAEAYWRLPTVFWLSASDAMLQGACVVGLLVSLLVVAGVGAPIAVAFAWGLYLSLVHAGQDFLSFQWDILLLESAFIAIFLAPMTLGARLKKEKPPSKIIVYLFFLLVFRLMFSSGAVKLDDETWRNLTALTYHYETQPLPTRFGWYVHQLPLAFHKFSVAAMFVVELALPVCIFGPRRLRHAVAIASISLMVGIGLAGNYTFFNWLMIALCLLLFDDQFYRALTPSRWRARLKPTPPESKKRRWATYTRAVLATLIVGLSSVYVYVLFLPASSIPRPFLEGLGYTRSFYLVNGYGLFAHMTTSRPEIIVEGSNDNATWRVYEFKWKPGDLKAAPRWVAPHQPRLDWQMWFAALSNAQQTPWFSSFMVRLLQGEEAVLALLDTNPFPDRPPKYVRAVLWDYRFTDRATLRDKGEWWRRDLRGLYVDPMALR